MHRRYNKYKIFAVIVVFVTAVVGCCIYSHRVASLTSLQKEVYNYLCLNSYVGSKNWKKYQYNPIIKFEGTAADPCVVWVENGYVIFFWHRDSKGMFTIKRAESKNGLEWENFENVLLQGRQNEWDSISVVSPSVVIYNGIWYMWYHSGKYPHYQIGLATSKDGVYFEKYRNNPVLKPGLMGCWDSLAVNAPEVIVIDGLFYMYYSGYGYLKKSIGLAISRDGITWKKFPGNPILNPEERWEGNRLQSPTILKHGETLYMWYTGTNRVRRIGIAVSKDGLNWYKCPTNPVIEPSQKWEKLRNGGMAVMEEKDRIIMWYHGDNDACFKIGVMFLEKNP